MGEIDEMRFSDAMRMADYWVMEPPISYLYFRSNFNTEKQDESSGLPPGFKSVPYGQLAPPLQLAVRRTWLKRNAGKTEDDFFKAQKEQGMKKFGSKLEEARKAKQNG